MATDYAATKHSVTHFVTDEKGEYRDPSRPLGSALNPIQPTPSRASPVWERLAQKEQSKD